MLMKSSFLALATNRLIVHKSTFVQKKSHVYSHYKLQRSICKMGNLRASSSNFTLAFSSLSLSGVAPEFQVVAFLCHWHMVGRYL
jgi:hypothetical protein